MALGVIGWFVSRLSLSQTFHFNLVTRIRFKNWPMGLRFTKMSSTVELPRTKCVRWSPKIRGAS